MENLSVTGIITETEIEKFKKELLNNKSLIDQKNLSGSTALHISILHGNYELVKFLVENGSNINSQDIAGNTPLHYCAEYNQYEIATLLLNNGADLNISDKYGNQPLWTATHLDKGKDERINMINLFLDNDANKHHENNVNKAPLVIALRYSNLTELFLKYK